MKRLGPFHWFFSVVIYAICWGIIWSNATFILTMVAVSLVVESKCRRISARQKAGKTSAPPAQWPPMDWPK